MSVYHPEFIYLANPLTASRAITAALGKIPGSVTLHPHHGRLSQVLQKAPNAVKVSTIFESVRNPLDWLVSRHMKGPDKGVAFKTWLRLNGSPLFFKFLGEATSFIRFESLEADIYALTGYEVNIEFDPDHATAGRQGRIYATQYDSDDLAWVRETFALDFKKYGYELP